MVKGKLVILTPPVDEDYELLAQWLGPSASGALLIGTQDFYSAETAKKYFSGENGSCLLIRDSSWEKLGFITWQKQRYEGSYELGAVIAERQMWDRGHGAEASLLVMHHLFHDKNAHRIQLMTGLHNKRMVKMLIRAAERGEIVLEGILRDYFFLDGEYQDALITSILRDEYYATLNPENYMDTIPASEKEEAKAELARYVSEHWTTEIIDRVGC